MPSEIQTSTPGGDVPDNLRELNGQPVLVNPGTSGEHPAVGMRGTLQVTPANEVAIVLQFAVMFDRPAAQRRITLSAAQVAELRAAKERTGDYTFTLPRDLEPPTGTGLVVASPPL